MFSKVYSGLTPDSPECIIGCFNYKGTLPKNLKMFYCLSYEINSVIPESLEYLYVYSVREDAIKSISQLSKLETLICDEYNPSCERDISLPSSLEHLQIKSSTFNITSFPSNLKTLIIPRPALPTGIRLSERFESLTLTNRKFTLDLHLLSGLKITFQSANDTFALHPPRKRFTAVSQKLHKRFTIALQAPHKCFTNASQTLYNRPASASQTLYNHLTNALQPP
jgi:hypothetical protein